MKKVLLAFMVLMVAIIGTSFTAFAEETDAAGPLAGIWDVTEYYEGAGNYYATWELTPKRGIIYSLTATRTGVSVQEGIGIEIGSNCIVKHPCYGEGCGDCGYTFKGKITGSTISGTVIYKCSNGTAYNGTFTATKIGAGPAGEIPQSDGVDPQ